MEAHITKLALASVSNFVGSFHKNWTGHETRISITLWSDISRKVLKIANKTALEAIPTVTCFVNKYQPSATNAASSVPFANIKFVSRSLKKNEPIESVGVGLAMCHEGMQPSY